MGLSGAFGALRRPPAGRDISDDGFRRQGLTDLSERDQQRVAEPAVASAARQGSTDAEAAILFWLQAELAT